MSTQWVDDRGESVEDGFEHLVHSIILSYSLNPIEAHFTY